MLLRTIRRLLIAALPACWSAAPAAPCPPAAPQPSLAQLQAAKAQDRGLLWRLQRDGRTSYLYGTLHVGRAEWVSPGPRVAAALAGSAVLALEIDPGDAGVQRDLAAADPTAAPLPAALQARLARQITAACLPEAAFSAMHPAMQAAVLAMLEARWVGLDPGYAQEQALARGARADGRRVVSLESVALQKKVLVPDEAAGLALIEQALEQLESGQGRSVMTRLARAWEHGDLATLEDYPRWCDCVRNDEERAAMRALNDDRNPALAERIEALHREGKPVFAAVGALHMTGPAGLPRLLAARGFRVERVVW